jgi:hypothetical protein
MLKINNRSFQPYMANTLWQVESSVMTPEKMILPIKDRNH